MKEVERSEALEWQHGTVTLDQVSAWLPDFGVRLQRGSMRNVLVEMGIRPIATGPDRTSKRGRVGYYDPLICWVVFVAHTAHESQKGLLRERLDEAREAARVAVWGQLADRPKERREYDQLAWDWRVESTAYHLFITDLRHGPEPRALSDALRERPTLLYRTLDSNMCLESVLRVYVARYIHRFAGPDVEPNEVNLFSGDREPLFDGRIKSTDTLGVLDQFGVLHAGGPRISQPDHLYFDAPEILDPEWGECQTRTM